MNSQLITVALLMGFVCGAFSQTIIIGGCDRATPMQEFELSRYLGKWYEIEATNHVEEIGASCIEARYADIGNGSVEVFNSEIIQLTGQLYTILGYANKENETNTEARFLVNFPTVGAYGAPYWVMDTDYDTYTIIWSCRPYGGGNSIQTLWYLNRNPTPESTVNDMVYQKIADLDLDHIKRTQTVRENCPVVP